MLKLRMPAMKMETRESKQARDLRDLALLTLRLTSGALLAGHGAQKLFGAFGGHGLEGTGGWLESMGLRPGRQWAFLGGASEFGGGLLMVLGFLNPLGPLSVIGSMAMATFKMHWGKPIWVTAGGAELPVTNIAVALALGMAGPGRFSLDRLFGLRLPRWLLAPGLAAVGAGVAYGLMISRQPEQAAEEMAAPQPEAPAEPVPAEAATLSEAIGEEPLSADATEPTVTDEPPTTTH
jgi:putative oxidoreductase